MLIPFSIVLLPRVGPFLRFPSNVSAAFRSVPILVYRRAGDKYLITSQGCLSFHPLKMSSFLFLNGSFRAINLSKNLVASGVKFLYSLSKGYTQRCDGSDPSL